ncbi:MAG TPA: hypothetical protein VG756_06610 [Pseudonocardiaceae bacterium]|jgi:hypothetical protein|nr:hypothetical protein [Pseudonocardiaceae bacterium]
MDSEHILFLVVGVVVVVAVGRLITHSGRSYVGRGQSAPGAASGANLVAVLFHLVGLGLVALLAVPSFGGPTDVRFLIRLGVLLLVIAAVYGITLTMLNRRRDEVLATELEAQPRHDPGEVTYGVGPEEQVEPVEPDQRPGMPR